MAEPRTGRRLPLVLGVTGHRDLRDEDYMALEARVDEVMMALQTRYPHTPLTLLSPLAEGADRLVARVALRHGIRLVVPLPLQEPVYEQDFQSSASLREFQDLLGSAASRFTLPLVGTEFEADLQAWRDRQYAQVGAYIACTSHILIALWDGVVVPVKAGGTGPTVQLRLSPKRKVEPFSGQQPYSTCLGPVYHILSPRLSNPHPTGKPFALTKLLPVGHDGASYEASQARLERINKAILSFSNT